MADRAHPSFIDFVPPELRDVSATAGQALPPGSQAAPREALAEALRTVHDPEIPVNIYDLGLIYRLDIDAAGDVEVDMTLTAPACPVAGALPQQVADTLAEVPGVGNVTVSLVWEPPWDKDRMSEDARLALGFY